MELTISASKFGFAAKPRVGEEPAVELALELEDDPLIDLLRDLSDGGATILIADDAGQALLIETALDLLGINAAPCPRNYRGRILGQQELERWCAEQAFVVDREQAIRLIRTEMLIGCREPRRPEAFRRVITVSWDQATPPERPILVIESGGDQATVPAVGLTESRFFGDVTRIITTLATQAGPKRSAIVLPRIRGGVTTLAEEVGFLKSFTDWVMFGYKPPVGQVPVGILQILLVACEEKVEVSTQVKAELRRIIAEYVRRGEPVPISLTLAMGIVIPNPLKFLEWVNLPTYGWVYLAWFFQILNEKIKRIYEPGIRLLVFEEGVTFGPWIGLSPEEVERCLLATRKIVEAVGAPIEILPMLPEHFQPEGEMTPREATDEEIYAIVCSLPNMTDPRVMAPLYVDRQRSYPQLRRLAGSFWEEAAAFARRKNTYLAYRKVAELFQKLSGLRGMLDAAITDKAHRLSFDITSPAMWNHGMPVVTRLPSGKVSVQIIPEYRIEAEFPKARPVRISPREFGLEGPLYTFYYLVE